MQMLEVCRDMARSRLVLWSAGNVSARCGESEFLITPAAVPYERIRAGEMIRVDLDSGKYSEGRPSSELALHLGLMRALSSTGAVVHTHSKHAAAFAVARRPIPFICNENLGVRARRIEVTEFAPPGTPAIATACLKVFAAQPGTRAVLLANHGVVAIGDDIESAYVVAQQVEWVAEVCLLAQSLGAVNELSETQQDAMAASYSVTLASRAPEREVQEVTNGD
jgi:L-fuculose-phosphate aldolase